MLKDVSFYARAGEIVGFSGLVGAGRTETIRTIFGTMPVDSGEIIYQGEQLRFKSPRSPFPLLGYLADMLVLPVRHIDVLADTMVAVVHHIDVAPAVKCHADRVVELRRRAGSVGITRLILPARVVTTAPPPLSVGSPLSVGQPMKTKPNVSITTNILNKNARVFVLSKNPFLFIIKHSSKEGAVRRQMQGKKMAYNVPAVYDIFAVAIKECEAF